MFIKKDHRNLYYYKIVTILYFLILVHFYLLYTKKNK